MLLVYLKYSSSAYQEAGLALSCLCSRKNLVWLRNTCWRGQSNKHHRPYYSHAILCFLFQWNLIMNLLTPAMRVSHIIPTSKPPQFKSKQFFCYREQETLLACLLHKTANTILTVSSCVVWWTVSKESCEWWSLSVVTAVEAPPVRKAGLLLPSGVQTEKVLLKGRDLKLECIPEGLYVYATVTTLWV